MNFRTLRSDVDSTLYVSHTELACNGTSSPPCWVHYRQLTVQRATSATLHVQPYGVHGLSFCHYLVPCPERPWGQIKTQPQRQDYLRLLIALPSSLFDCRRAARGASVKDEKLLSRGCGASLAPPLRWEFHAAFHFKRAVCVCVCMCVFFSVTRRWHGRSFGARLMSERLRVVLEAETCPCTG